MAAIASARLGDAARGDDPTVNAVRAAAGRLGDTMRRARMPMRRIAAHGWRHAPGRVDVGAVGLQQEALDLPHGHAARAVMGGRARVLPSISIAYRG